MKNNKQELVPNEKSDLVKSKKIQKLKSIFSGSEARLAEEESKLIERYVDSENKLDRDEKIDVLEGLMGMYGLDNGKYIAHISKKKHQLGLSKMRQSLIRENGSKDSIELMLIDKIIASYWRVIRYETLFNNLIEDDNNQANFTQLSVNILKEINKGLEIAHRQHSNNLILLKELKQPSLNVTVKTGNAYFAQNQQINNKDNAGSKDSDEIIKS